MADRELKIKVTTDTSGAQRGLNALSGSWTEFNSMLSTAGRGVRAVGQVYDATVGALLEYADVVGDLASITGESMENTSRFVTVLGEFGIEMSQITAAGRSMRDEGLVPTLDTLAQLSDQYLALVPGIERVNFLQETFGRQGQEFVDILEQGSAAIRDRSDAVSAGNVLTTEEKAATDELRLTLAGLNTSWTGLMLTLAQVVVPGLVLVVGAVNTLATSVANGTSLVEQFSAAMLRMAEISGRVPGVTIPVVVPAISGRGGVRGESSKDLDQSLDLDQWASGGRLGRGWNLVGDAGPELISPWGEVIPASQTMSMLRGGLIPRHKFVYGTGEQGGYVPAAARKPLAKVYTGSIFPATPMSAISGGTSSPAAVAEIAATAGAAGATATLPAVVAMASTAQAEAVARETRLVGDNMVAEIRAMRRDLARLGRQLPTSIRDAVERVL